MYDATKNIDYQAELLSLPGYIVISNLVTNVLRAQNLCIDVLGYCRW